VEQAVVGFPDRMLLVPGGTITFVELKTRRGRVSKIQVFWHRVLAGMGYRVEVVRTVEEFRRVLTASTVL
jgi:hypothetical protein